MMLDTLRNVVATHSATTVFRKELPSEPCDGSCNPEDCLCGTAGLLVDVQTAHVMLGVYDALTRESTRAKFTAMIETPHGFVRCAEFAWMWVNKEGDLENG